MILPNPLAPSGAGAAMQPPAAGEPSAADTAMCPLGVLPNNLPAGTPAAGWAPFSLGRIATYAVIPVRACRRCQCDYVPAITGQRICQPCAHEARSGAMIRRHAR